MLFGHGALCLLLAGLSAATSGWLLRRLIAEGEAETLAALRAKLLEAVRAIESLRARVESERARADGLNRELAVERRRGEERERDLQHHERHIVELADEAAARDRELAALRRQVESLEARARGESERVRKAGA
ncbi:MAG: hypothetical protein U0324_33610 [Polyangiales bacterium]